MRFLYPSGLDLRYCRLPESPKPELANSVCKIPTIIYIVTDIPFHLTFLSNKISAYQPIRRQVAELSSWRRSAVNRPDDPISPQSTPMRFFNGFTRNYAGAAPRPWGIFPLSREDALDDRIFIFMCIFIFL
jgi:hypothetical protein